MSSVSEVAPEGPWKVRFSLWSAVYALLGLVFAIGYLWKHFPLLPLSAWTCFGCTHAWLVRRNLRRLRISILPETPRCVSGSVVHFQFSATRWRQTHAPRALDCLLQTIPPSGRLHVRNDGSIGGAPRSHRIAHQTREFGALKLTLTQLESGFPFHLWRLEQSLTMPIEASVIVWPKPQRLPRKRQRWREEKTGVRVIAGRALPERGLDIRPYASGDSPRDVCWKSTARLGELQIRPKLRADRSPRCLVIETGRKHWERTRDFWRMVQCAADLVREEATEGGIALLEIDGETLSLATRAQRITALDRIALLRPLHRARPAKTSRPLPALFLRARPGGGVNLLDGRQREVLHVR